MSATAELESQLSCLTHTNAFLNKYFSLRKRCEQLQQSNEKLVNRIHHVKKLIKRYKRDKRCIIIRLDQHGDQCCDAEVPFMWEQEDTSFNHLLPPPPYSQELESESTSSGGKASVLSSIQPLLMAHGISDSMIASVAGNLSSSLSGVTKRMKSDKGKELHISSKPANAFLMFCQQRKPSIQEEYVKQHGREISHQELTRCLAQQWNNLTQGEKMFYYDLYDLEKKACKKEINDYSVMDLPPASDACVPLPAREGAIPSLSLQLKKEKD